MKQIYTTIILVLFFTIQLNAQNLYPISKNSYIKLDGGAIKLIKPETTGGWARGLFYYNTNQTRWAGVRLFGAGNSINNIYIAHGENPWSSGLEAYIKPN